MDRAALSAVCLSVSGSGRRSFLCDRSGARVAVKVAGDAAVTVRAAVAKDERGAWRCQKEWRRRPVAGWTTNQTASARFCLAVCCWPAAKQTAAVFLTAEQLIEVDKHRSLQWIEKGL